MGLAFLIAFDGIAFGWLLCKVSPTSTAAEYKLWFCLDRASPEA